MRSHAMRMSPSRNGSWGGRSPSRNARAASGSVNPRRTRTPAVNSLTPSASASSDWTPCGHGRTVQVPSCIVSSRYGGRRTTSRETPEREATETSDTAPTLLDQMSEHQDPQNELFFRRLNESIRNLRTMLKNEMLDAVCECADVGCFAPVALPFDDFERIRSD